MSCILAGSTYRREEKNIPNQEGSLHSKSFLCVLSPPAGYFHTSGRYRSRGSSKIIPRCSVFKVEIRSAPAFSPFEKFSLLIIPICLSRGGLEGIADLIRSLSRNTPHKIPSGGTFLLGNRRYYTRLFGSCIYYYHINWRLKIHRN